jgi:hypothetical protein
MPMTKTPQPSWKKRPKERCSRADYPILRASVEDAEAPGVAPNGGSARGYQRDLRDAGAPRSARHAADRHAYLCIAVLHEDARSCRR